MSDCQFCPVESECHYPYKPTECVQQRKFWSKEQSELSRLREQNAELAEALSVNTHRSICPECERWLVDGEPHDKTCKYSPIMAMAEKILGEQPTAQRDELDRRNGEK